MDVTGERARRCHAHVASIVGPGQSEVRHASGAGTRRSARSARPRSRRRGRLRQRKLPSTQSGQAHTAVILGKCKDRGPLKIAEFREAVDGLHKLALAFPKERFKTFVLPTKLAPFTSEEIEVARTLNDGRHLRAILLTDQELEPYDIYERSTIVSERRKYASTPEDFAWATSEQYFGPLGDRAALGMDA